MIEMPQDPVRGPDPADPHDTCERDIARLEGEVEAANQVTARALTFAELHRLAGELIGDHSYAVTVERWNHLGGHHEMSWRVSWFPDDANVHDCRTVSDTTAAGAYAKLRDQLSPPSTPLDEVGDIPW